ncbi:MAG TPA: phosphatidylglycerol lysyltransferase domain-containing protein [Nitrospiria bacterium]|nr:phosphatidylglycerol lysyltransferase domain-containing protein [Nitrospiria bacterium]
MNPFPQLVPNSRCLACDVCCRFPEKDSPLAPYFTAEEIRRAVERGIPPERFDDPKGGRIELLPHPRGEGYICPAFDPAVNGCRIYDDRPLDCQLFPLALMWDPSKRTVLLGFDRKCPFIVETFFAAGPFEYGRSMAVRLETDETIKTLRAHPGLIGAYQEDVMILTPLARLSEALTGRPAAHGARVNPESVGLTPLTDADRPLFESAMRWTPTELSSYSWPALTVWKDHLRYYWAIIGRQFCLFARYVDGLFMPLPPIGETLTHEAVRQCFDRMDAINSHPAISRIENLDAGQVPAFESMGLVVKPKEQEYLYDREALVRLAGDRYKTKRWACNRFVREHRKDPVRIEPYRSSDRDDCLDLFSRWKRQHAESGRSSGNQEEDRMMLEDAASAHRRALEESVGLGLTGRVARRGGRIVGYTFGFRFRPDIFCVLLEVADREVAGLSAYLFREFCREMSGFSTIHAMDDSGLERLRAAKLSYHPSKVLTSYIATRPARSIKKT